MANIFLNLDILQKILLNTIFVSIPEEIYFVLFTLILMGEFDYWKEEECKKLFSKWDYVRVLVPAVPASLVTNTLRYTGADINISSNMMLLVMFVLIVLTGDLWRDTGLSVLKWVAKALVFLILAALSVIVAEMIYVPLILRGTGMSLREINNDILLNFAASIPARLMQYSIITFLVVKKRTVLKANIFNIIFKSRVLSVLTISTIFLDFVFSYIIIKATAYNEILINLSFGLSAAITIGTAVFPVLNISTLIWGVYYVKNNEISKQKTAANLLDGIANEINMYENSENSDILKWKINGIEKNIKEISKKLYESQ